MKNKHTLYVFIVQTKISKKKMVGSNTSYIRMPFTLMFVRKQRYAHPLTIF